MSQSFLDIRDRPIGQKIFLRSDWSAEEKNFEDGKSAFLIGAGIANTVKFPEYDFCAENKKTEIVAVADVANSTENNSKINQGSGTSSVVSSYVPAQKCGQDQVTSEVSVLSVVPSVVPATKESSVLSEDIFGEVAKPKIESFLDDDFFSDNSQSSAKPSVKAEDSEPFVVPPPKPKETAIDPLEEIFGETPKSTSLVKSQSVANVSSNEIACPVVVQIDNSHDAEAMEGFNMQRFEKVRATAQQMLDWLPQQDLSSIMNSLPNYVAELNLDYLREHQNELTDKLMEVQSKRDSLHAVVVRVTPAFYNSKSAADYFTTAGLDCSTASSKDKRVAQIKFVIPEFWINHAKIIATMETVQKVFDHLAGQYECISRLITGWQTKMKISDIARGEEAYEEPVVKRHVLVDSESAHFDMSQPISAPKAPKFESCQSFANVAKQSSKKVSAGVGEW